MNDTIENIAWEVRRCAKIAWLVIKHRPFFRCPFCGGAGGEMSGYYEPEWSECRCCYDYYEGLEDYGCWWFVGRVSLVQWLRAKASIRAGLWYAAALVDIARCGFGWHRWMDETDTEPGLHICACCYQPKRAPVKKEPAK